MDNEGEPILPKLHFMKNTRKAFGVITLPLREGKIFCNKILGGGLEAKSKNRQFLFFLVYKRFIFFFKKDSRRGLLRFSQSKFHFDFEDDSPQGPASPSAPNPVIC